MKTRRPTSRDGSGARKRTPPQYRDIFEYASIGICRTTLEGRFLIANPALASMLGYDSVAEVLTLNVARDVYLRAGDRTPVIRKYAEVRVPWTAEFQWRRKDGTPIWVLVSGRAVRDAADRIRYFEAYIHDVTERRHGAEEIADSRRRLRHLSRRLHEVTEQERKRIARGIHDDLGQPLTALRMDLAWLSARLAPDAAPLLAKMRAMEQVVDETIDRVRDIATQLRPAVLDDLGLVPAIEGEAEALQQRSGLRCELDLPRDATGLDEQRATTLFRVLQEALTNVARHAGATLVRIHLRVTPGEIALEVSDDGRGITDSDIANHRSIGVLGMRERVAAWGGEFGILGLPGGGTRVTACLPLAHQAPGPDTS
jgi:PAS domain S-box-containing protein